MAPAPPALVAERLCELLWSFPTAAISGVQWQTLARKYEERHGSRLSAASLGHASALAAASALLQDVLRLVEASDTENPVVALEDALVMAPRPGSLASWPSLYHALCSVVEEHGCLVNHGGAEGEVTHELLFSQLKPLLQRHWHSSFDEGNLSYFTEEGSPVRLKKMKHLLQAVLRWRDQRVSWQAESNAQAPAMHEALLPRIELVPSSTHNDLLLRCARPPPDATGSSRGLHSDASLARQQNDRSESETTDALSLHSCSGRSDTDGGNSDHGTPSCGVVAPYGLAREVASLRAENERLRCRNALLEHRAQDAALRAELFGAPSKPTNLDAEVFDDPFEPPPEARITCGYRGPGTSPVGSTEAPGSLCFSSRINTPRSEAAASHSHSGSVTPAGLGTPGQVCTFMPVWFAMGDRVTIPSGVVQQARSVFERGTESGLPSFFARQ